MSTEWILDHDAAFNGDQKERSGGTLTKVEEEYAKHFTEGSRCFQVGHHRAEELGEEAGGKTHQIEDRQGEKQNERGRASQWAAHQNEEHKGIQDNTDNHDAVGEEDQVIQGEMPKGIVPLTEQGFIVQKIDVVGCDAQLVVTRVIEREVQRSIARADQGSFRPDAASGVPLRYSGSEKGDRWGIQSEIIEEDQITIDSGDSRSAGERERQEGKDEEEKEQSQVRGRTSSRCRFEKSPLGEVRTQMVSGEKEVHERIELFNDGSRMNESMTCWHDFVEQTLMKHGYSIEMNSMEWNIHMCTNIDENSNNGNNPEIVWAVRMKTREWVRYFLFDGSFSEDDAIEVRETWSRY